MWLHHRLPSEAGAWRTRAATAISRYLNFMLVLSTDAQGSGRRSRLMIAWTPAATTALLPARRHLRRLGRRRTHRHELDARRHRRRQRDRNLQFPALAAHRPLTAERIFDEVEPVGRGAAADGRVKIVELFTAAILRAIQ